MEGANGRGRRRIEDGETICETRVRRVTGGRPKCTEWEDETDERIKMKKRIRERREIERQIN